LSLTLPPPLLSRRGGGKASKYIKHSETGKYLSDSPAS
jgi:hypothetical protein